MPQLSEEELKNMSPEQLMELQKQNCPFCLIGSGKLPAKKVYEDDNCVAVLDINPANSGHVILFPKDHKPIMAQLDKNITEHLGVIAKKISQVMLKAFKDKGVQGTNIMIASGAAAGQKVPHLAINIIPRNEGDELNNFILPKKKIGDNDMKALQKLLTSAAGLEAKEEVEKKEVEPKKEEPTEKIEEPAPPEESKSADLNTISNILNQPVKEDVEEEPEKKEEEEESNDKPESEEPEKNEGKKDSEIDLDSIANLLGK